MKNNELLRELAEKLGTTVEHLWQVLVKQAALGAFDAVLGMVFAGLILWLCRYWIKIQKESEEIGLIQFVAGIGMIIASFIFLLNLYWLFTAILNPEYWALERVLSLLK